MGKEEEIELADGEDQARPAEQGEKAVIEAVGRHRRRVPELYAPCVAVDSA